MSQTGFKDIKEVISNWFCELLLREEAKLSTQDDQLSRFALECAGFSTESLTAQETAQPQAYQGRSSP